MNSNQTSNQTAGPLVSWTQFIYALHAFSLLTGILGAATIIQRPDCDARRSPSSKETS
jgi:hypothetical protein